MTESKGLHRDRAGRPAIVYVLPSRCWSQVLARRHRLHLQKALMAELAARK